MDENISLEELRNLFANDRFATQAAGCHIVEGRKGHSVCEMPLVAIHRNAQGNIMGGAIFTLADFALAVACNIGQAPSVSVDTDIRFLSTIKGSTLIATCDADKMGRSLGFFTIAVDDDLGTPVAVVSATVARVR